ncbi:MAG: hypothetical protein L0211_07645 [Planctomycetaceae bacterium]|nr:hypothetical protein [Planctomycetaceae bacterium]
MASSSSPSDAHAASGPAPGGFGRLARRIAGWTANLLATALVLVAGLAVGRQVLIWWYESPPARLAAASDQPLPPETSEELRLWTTRGPMSIERVIGDKDAAIAAMRQRCESSPAATVMQPAGPGEQRFLETLVKLAPVEQTKELDLYVPPGDVTMVVAVSRDEPRIAAWSFALEAEPATWTCYTFCPAAK